MALLSRHSSPGIYADGRFRQAVGSGSEELFPSTWRFRDRSLTCRLVLPFHFAEAKLPCSSSWPFEIDLPAARQSPHLRFARFVPRNARGVFSDVAAGIAAASFGLNFLDPFQGFPPSKVRANHPLDTQKLRLKSESRKKTL